MVVVTCGEKYEIFQTSNGAINGYDVVSYFDGKPKMGSDDLKYNWKGATWHFISEKNLEEFKEYPEKYAPQYGGFCAFATAEGHKAPTEPDTWILVDGTLYFNSNAQVRTELRSNQSEFIKGADANWPKAKDME